MKDRSDPTQIRQSLRVPVDNQDDISVILENKSYRVVNLCQDGVNIANPDHSPFTIGELIKNCDLVLPGGSISNLTARIIHCSCESDGNWNNGIQWTDLTENGLKQIAETVLTIKQKLRKQFNPV